MPFGSGDRGRFGRLTGGVDREGLAQRLKMPTYVGEILDAVGNAA
jgi:hypothetical protein